MKHDISTRSVRKVEIVTQLNQVELEPRTNCVANMAVAQKSGMPKWGALVSGNMDQHPYLNQKWYARCGFYPEPRAEVDMTWLLELRKTPDLCTYDMHLSFQRGCCSWLGLQLF